MIRWIVGASLKFRRLVIAAAVGLIAFGIFQLRDTPVEALPEFAPVRVEVQTESLGLSAEEVEQLITNPLEQEFFNGVAWLSQIKSSSIPGLSSIEMTFEPGTDVMRARQVVQERLTMSPALPAASSRPPFVIQPVSSTSRLLLIGLSAKDLEHLDVGVLARWTIQPRLLAIPGVANVSIWGHRDRQLQVLVDPARLKQNGVSLNQIIRTTGNALWVSRLTFVEASTPGTGGFVDTANQRIDIQHNQPIRTAQDLAKVTIEGAENAALRLGDVAQIVEDHQPLIGDAVVGDQANMLLVVERFPGTSVADVTQAVESALDDMAPGLTGLETDTSVFREASFVEEATRNITTTLLIGFGLLLLLLGAFLYNWRAALISAATIVVSLAAAVVVLSLFGFTLNLMILAGLVMAVAVVVHDAVVDVDNVRRRLRQRAHEPGDSGARVATVVDAVVEMRGTLFVATLIALAPVVPVVLLGEMTGAILRPFGFSYALAILASMAVALIVAPSLAMALFAKESTERAESPLARRLRRGYTALLTPVVGRPVMATAAAGLLAVFAVVAALPVLSGQQLTPPLEDRNLVVRWDATPGASLLEMNRITTVATAELRAVPGVRNVGALVGRAISSDQVSTISSGELLISIDAAVDYHATVAAVQEVIDGYPGLTRNVSTYADDRLQQVDPATKEPIVVRVYGNDYTVLQAKADEVVRDMSEVDGVSEPRVKTPDREPTVEIEVSIDKAASHGLKPAEVRRSAATLMSGIYAGNLFEEQKVFDVVVWGTPSTRQNLASMRELLVDKPDGGQVRLDELADVRIKANPSAITHDAVSRYIDVVADVRGRSVGSVTDDVKTRLQQVAFPREHHLEVLGDSATRQGNELRTVLFVIAVAILIFFLLQAGLGSWRLAITVFLMLPAAVAGGVLVAMLFGDAMSVVSLLGLLAVLAIAVRAGMLLVKHCQRLEQEGRPLGPDLVLTGAQEVFSSTVLAVLAAGLVLAPVVVFGSVAGLEAIQPMAAVILGGLVSTTLVVLFLLPAFLRFGSGHAEPEIQPSSEPSVQGA